jgi:hypothetical protein
MTEPKITYYKNLQVWQKSVDLVEQTYILTQKFPKIIDLYRIKKSVKL